MAAVNASLRPSESTSSRTTPGAVTVVIITFGDHRIFRASAQDLTAAWDFCGYDVYNVEFEHRWDLWMEDPTVPWTSCTSVDSDIYKCVAQLCQPDDGHQLMIVCYIGHGSVENGKLLARSSIWPHPRFSISLLQQEARDDFPETDFLLVLDCCFADYDGMDAPPGDADASHTMETLAGQGQSLIVQRSLNFSDRVAKILVEQETGRTVEDIYRALHDDVSASWLNSGLRIQRPYYRKDRGRPGESTHLP